MTSPRASGSGLPCSWVSVRAIASARSRIRSAVFLRILARSYADRARQAGNAFAAASIARSASARPPKATSVSVDSSAGLITGSVLPSVASTHRPSMNICEGRAEAVVAMVVGSRALTDSERMRPEVTITGGGLFGEDGPHSGPYERYSSRSRPRM